MDKKDMEELEKRLKRQTGDRNYNFFRPVGQFIEHVDTINFSMDKDGNFHFENVGQVNGLHQQQEIGIQDIVNGVRICSKFIWGPAAMGVVFGISRDKYHLQYTVTDFERAMNANQLNCPEGTIANAMRNNPYLKLHYTKWAANGAKQRTIKLSEEFQKAVEQRETT